MIKQISVMDTEFKKYGKVIGGYDLKEILQKMEQVHRAIRFWKPIREAHHATYSPCLKSLGKRPHLSEKSEKICSENS